MANWKQQKRSYVHGAKEHYSAFGELYAAVGKVATPVNLLDRQRARENERQEYLTQVLLLRERCHYLF